MKRTIFFGSPGTGKTTTLLARLEEVLKEGISPQAVAFLTFTRRARREALERVEKVLGIEAKELPHFRTIHSMAFKGLGLKEGDVLGRKELDRFGASMGLQFGANSASEVASEGINSQEKGDALLALDNLARLRGHPIERTWREARSDIDWHLVDHFARSYLQYKRDTGLLDFTDVLSEFAKSGKQLDVDVAFIDEAQDLSALQWLAALQAVTKAQLQFVAGDDDQCQPAGTMVLTPEGEIPIEELKNGMAVITFDRNGSHIVGQRKIFYRVKTTSHLYYGHLYKFSVGKTATVTTDIHLCMCKFNAQARQKKVVYLMRRGKNYRIGQTQLCRIDGVVLLGHKLRLEKADAIWILAVCNTPQEAHYYEQLYALKFGLPQLCFVFHGGATILTQKQLDAIHNSTDTTAAAMNCLKFFGLREDKPFWSPARSKSKRGGASIFIMEACNVLSGVMSMMLYEDTAWHPVKVSRLPIGRTRVYALSVPKHQTYFADGIYTHNCIYKWAGAEVEVFMSLEGDRVVLNKSHRLPSVIHAAALKLSARIKNRVEKDFEPRAQGGQIKHHATVQSIEIKEGEQWLWLVRNRYLLPALRETLERRDIVYSEHGQSSIYDGDVEAIYTWERLRKGTAVRVDTIRALYKRLSTKIQIKHGFKLLPNVGEGTTLTLENLRASHGLLVIGDPTWYEVLQSMPHPRRTYYRALLRAHGTLKLKPQVQLETIHGSKGTEAPQVALFLECSRRVWEEWQLAPDEEHRVWYVGATRAREVLHVVQGNSPWSYPFPK